MTTATLIDDTANETTDFVLAELDRMREQLSAIEAALPDHGPSFSALEQETAHIKAQLDKIAASPSVKLSAEQHAYKSAHSISEILAPSLNKLQTVIDGTQQRQSDLIRLTNALHVRSMERPFAWIWPTVGLMVGFWLYPLIATSAPGGTSLAALATGHRDRWAAGSDLMSAANPESWAAITRASQILAENQDAFMRCVAAADRTKTKQACTIQVGPALGQK
jgi:hypothetical protein